VPQGNADRLAEAALGLVPTRRPVPFSQDLTDASPVTFLPFADQHLKQPRAAGTNSAPEQQTDGQ